MSLRDMGSADVEPFVAAFLADPPLSEALGQEDDPSAAEVRDLLEAEPGRRERGEGVRLAMADPASDAYLGDVVLHTFHWAHLRAEVGIFLVPAARGRGVATEALRLLSGWAFAALGLWRIGITTLTDNARMHRLATRAGFRHEGVLRGYTLERGRHLDNVVYSLLRAEAPA